MSACLHACISVCRVWPAEEIRSVACHTAGPWERRASRSASLLRNRPKHTSSPCEKEQRTAHEVSVPNRPSKQGVRGQVHAELRPGPLSLKPHRVSVHTTSFGRMDECGQSVASRAASASRPAPGGSTPRDESLREALNCGNGVLNGASMLPAFPLLATFV